MTHRASFSFLFPRINVIRENISANVYFRRRIYRCAHDARERFRRYETFCFPARQHVYALTRRITRRGETLSGEIPANFTDLFRKAVYISQNRSYATNRRVVARAADTCWRSFSVEASCCTIFWSIISPSIDDYYSYHTIIRWNVCSSRREIFSAGLSSRRLPAGISFAQIRKRHEKVRSEKLGGRNRRGGVEEKRRNDLVERMARRRDKRQGETSRRPPSPSSSSLGARNYAPG